jgi:hypothetical protein
MKRFQGILILVGYLLLAGLTLYIVDYMTKSAIEGALIRWMPWTLRLNFLLILAGGLLYIIRTEPLFPQVEIGALSLIIYPPSWPWGPSWPSFSSPPRSTACSTTRTSTPTSARTWPS